MFDGLCYLPNPNRSLSMDIVKLFMLKHADSEPVIINNITYADEHAESTRNAIGAPLVEKLEVLVRTLLVLQELNWMQERGPADTVHWREENIENYVAAFVEPQVSNPQFTVKL